MEIATAFGLALRALRRQAGLTQEQLGFESGLERNFISMLELGQRQPSLATVFKLAKALNVAPAQIVQLADDTLKLDEAGPAP